MGDKGREALAGAREASEGGSTRNGVLSKRETDGGGVLSGWPCAWPDKPKLDAETFEKFCAAVRTECADACRFFLIGKCRKPDCKRPHKVPEAFLRIKERFN